MNSNIVIFSACADAEEAQRIAHALVEERLAGCVQILPKMRSVYRWQGKVESAEEHLLLIKTAQVRFDAVQAKIKEMHSYEVPEVIAIAITAGSDPYLEWLEAMVRCLSGTRAALIFDMDGVIVDSNPVHRDAWVQFNRTHGVETTEAMQQRMYGKRNDEIIRDFLGGGFSDADVFAFGAAKEVMYREMIAPLLPGALVPGVRAFLERHQDIAVGCATNAEPANVDFVLEAAGLQGLFRVAVNGHQVSRPKPFPDIYLKAAELLGVQPRHCLVFEDSYTGIEAARAAGMQVVGLRTTHDRFDDVALEIDDFLAPELEPFLQSFLDAQGRT